MEDLRCVVASRAWRDGRLIDDDISATELAALVDDRGALVWFDLLRPEPDELAVLAERLHLAPTVIEDATAPLERAKVTRHDSHLFFTVYATRLDAVDPRDARRGRMRPARISGFVLPNLLVTLRLDDDFDMARVVRRWEENPDLLVEGAGALVHGLMDHVVDGHFDTIQRLDDEVERLEDILFEETPTGREFVRDVYGLRRDLVELRRVVLPMREVVNALLRHGSLHPATIDDPRAPGGGRRRGSLDAWYDDLYDHVLRAAEWTESLRDMVTSLFETNLSINDTRLNTIMKKLAGWAAIIAVPTAVTGWFGQNVPYPGFSEPLGLWLSVAIIVIIGGALFTAFRRWDWL